MFASLAMAITVMVATVLLLGLGMAVGYHLANRMGASGPPSIVIAPSEPLRDYSVSIDTAELMRAYAVAVLEATSRHRSAVPRELVQAIDQLVAITQKVSEQLAQSQVKKTMPPVLSDKLEAKAELSNPAPEQTAAKSPVDPTRLSAAEMVELASSTDRFSVDDSPRRRYTYHSYQRVFPIEVPGLPPSTGMARTVRCHDISVHGISFFWPDDPDFDHLVISLGADDKPIWMLAEVMQSKAVFMHDEIRTLVGCRFVGRYSWSHAPAADRAVVNCQANEEAVLV